MGGDSDSKKDEKIIVKVKNATDLQRLKLEKLMKNPDKPVVIPDRPRDKSLSAAPDFVRNVMGSSAGAGSGEFHVYRHLRRKEYARQKFIAEKSEKEKLDEDYHDKIERNKKLAEDKTAKKRAKRLKKKKLAKLKGKKPKLDNKASISSQSDSSEDEDDAEEPEKSSKGLNPSNDEQHIDKDNDSRNVISEDSRKSENVDITDINSPEKEPININNSDSANKNKS